MWESIKRICCSICKQGTQDVPSPTGDLLRDDIGYNKQTYELTADILPNVWLTGIADTNSMDGLMDYPHTVILSNNPKYLDNINVGDVVVWYKYGRWIIHQVIEVGQDDRWFCYTKGINNPTQDPWKIRREDIKWKGLGIIWTKGGRRMRKGIPRRDGSGAGKRLNRGRGGCSPTRKTGKRRR